MVKVWTSNSVNAEATLSNQTITDNEDGTWTIGETFTRTVTDVDVQAHVASLQARIDYLNGGAADDIAALQTEQSSYGGLAAP